MFFSFDEIFDLIESGKFKSTDFNTETMGFQVDETLLKDGKTIRDLFIDRFLPKEFTDLQNKIEG